ncbi:acyl-CoA carboxylase subunit epsilon [Streptomyces flavidovirens]|uniref:acyl-CoA carboxylase subunit epsilon n=1 Tax=Streptomyces flavidovirens TaxID=67298 RepID=UPI00040D7629|nr:acyl-CoA carboxylase subunit epsilon [Streptomyces flavidovirens]
MTARDTALLRVVRGNPAPEELAALTVAVLALSRDGAGEQSAATAPYPRWSRGAQAAPADGTWAGRARPGWQYR